jgi:hypothetical protein
MKYLILDIDGVLNSIRSCYAYKGFGHPEPNLTLEKSKLDPVAVKLIQRLIEETDAKVVVSSTWRILSEIKDFDFLELPIIDFTPNKFQYRGDEIKEWLDNHPDTESYVIIDDDSDMLEEQKPNFVHVDREYGFSWNDFCEAYLILTGEMNIYDPRRFKND